MFDWFSLVIGILIGAIIMTIIFWIAYATRTFVYAYCPTRTPTCTLTDYHNNPGDALANGADLRDILSLNQSNQLIYNRVAANRSCTPGRNQEVPVIYPQFCSFTIDGRQVVGKVVQLGSSTYYINNESQIIATEGHCIPQYDSIADDGIPLIRWDPSPLI